MPTVITISFAIKVESPELVGRRNMDFKLSEAISMGPVVQ
jgi:hypothetical protein